MPLFEYKCEDCGAEFEEIVMTSGDEILCRNCRSKNVKKLMSAGAIRPEGIPKGKGGFKAPGCSSCNGGCSRGN